MSSCPVLMSEHTRVSIYMSHLHTGVGRGPFVSGDIWAGIMRTPRGCNRRGKAGNGSFCLSASPKEPLGFTYRVVSAGRVCRKSEKGESFRWTPEGG